jgi:hypothetical protein
MTFIVSPLVTETAKASMESPRARIIMVKMLMEFFLKQFD